jgi:hypothetical protein
MPSIYPSPLPTCARIAETSATTRTPALPARPRRFYRLRGLSTATINPVMEEKTMMDSIWTIARVTVLALALLVALIVVA